MKNIEVKNKQAGFALLKELRAAGETCRLMKEEGIYTQPGVGITSYCNYYVEVK